MTLFRCQMKLVFEKNLATLPNLLFNCFLSKPKKIIKLLQIAHSEHNNKVTLISHNHYKVTKVNLTMV